jgi:peptidoglycan/xylan/chitin deacetylase (PgdA/CDA1 family)
LIALTFDDGSEQDCTSHILDAFSAHGGQATFFVLGSSIAGNEDLLKRAVAEGHELGNHLFSHESPIGRSDVFIWREIEQANRAIYEAASSSPSLVRPPFGHEPERVATVGAGLGFTHVVLWSIMSSDWENPAPQLIAQRVLRAAEPGALVLLHDGAPPGDPTRRGNTAAAVEFLMPPLRREFELVTVSDLLDAPAGWGSRSSGRLRAASRS